MTLGQKLKDLRSLKGLTQKELADKLHVSFQTVSKWENGENEPDISTLRELAKLFNCSLDYLLSEDDGEPTIRKDDPVSPPTTVVVHKEEVHVCAKCGKDIPESELVSEDAYRRERHGRMVRTVNIGQTYYHKECLEQVKRQRSIDEQARKDKAASRVKKIAFGWSIAGGVVALGVFLGIFLGACAEFMNPAVAVVLSIVFSYAIFADIYCIICLSYIGEVFVSVATWSIRFPGLIFTWDLGGFVWLIGMKILFAILGFLFGIFVVFLAIAISAFLATFSFPFILIHNIRTDYKDAIVDSPVGGGVHGRRGGR